MAVCAAGVAVIGLLGVIAWIAGISWLKSFSVSHIEMKFITAATFVIAAASLLPFRSSPRGSDIAAFIVMVLGGVSLLEYIFGVNLGIDSFLIREAPGAVETIHPGRMAPNTALGFVVFGIAVLTQRSRLKIASIGGQFATMILILIPLSVLMGYAYSARSLRGLEWTSPMALPTAIALALLAVTAATLHRDEWPFLLVQGDYASASVARRLIAAVFVLTFLFGWLRLHGERTALYRTEVGVALFALFNMIVLSLIVVLTVTKMRRAEEYERQRTRLLQGTIHTLESLAGSSLEAEAVAESITTRAQDLARSDGAIVVVRDGDAALVRSAIGIAAPLRGTTTSLDEGVIAADVASRISAQSVGVIPLRYNGESLGAIAVASLNEHAFGDPECDALRLIAPTAAARIAQAGQFEIKSAYVREQSAALTTLRQQFTAFMENIPAASFIKDPSGNYLYANPSLERMLRADLPDILGAKDSDILPPEIAAALRAGETTMLEDDTVVPVTIRIFVDEDAPYWLLLRFPIHYGANRVFIGGVAVDVSEIKRAERRIEELNATLEARVAARTAEVERANRELEAFSYSVSHDLRSPLRAVSGYARIVEEDYGASLDDEGRRYLEVIRSEGARMGNLIDDLLAFSRVGRQHLAVSEVDMKSLIANVVDEVRHSYRDREIELTAASLPSAWGDRATLRQVVMNLVSNAAKYAKPDGTIRIETGGRSDGDLNVYWIRDHGVGFDMRYADKLFQVFQRLHGADQFEGTGVGLAIVERIVARHGGRVWAEGEVGKGATFYFTLPANSAVTRGLSVAANLD